MTVFIILLFFVLPPASINTADNYQSRWREGNYFTSDHLSQASNIQERRRIFFKAQKIADILKSKCMETKLHKPVFGKNTDYYKGLKQLYNIYPNQPKIICYPASQSTEENRNNGVHEALNELVENVEGLQIRVRETEERIASFRSYLRQNFNTGDHENEQQSEVSGGSSRSQSAVSAPVSDRDRLPSINNTVTSVWRSQRLQRPNNHNRHATRNLNIRWGCCVFPEYRSHSSRRSTFNNWQSPGQSPDEMTEAGFFCIGNDCVRCYACGIGLRCWEETDDPWLEHIKFSKDCPHVLECKGKDYIDIVNEVARMSNNLQEETPVRPRQQGATVGIDDQRRQQQREIRNPLQHPVAQEAIRKGFTPCIVTEAIEKIICDYGFHSLSFGLLLGILYHMKQSSRRFQQTDEATSTRQDDVQDVEEERRHLIEKYQCKICFENDVQIVFLPCRHACCCVQCAFAMNKCPICRKNINGTVRIRLEY